MADLSAPPWKIYDADGDYQASTKDPEAAACLCSSFYGDDATVRFRHGTIVWRGNEPVDSWEAVGERMYRRARAAVGGRP